MNCLSLLIGREMQPAVGPKSDLATWMNTALPRPVMRGR